MLRITEVIADMLGKADITEGYCISLNDSTDALAKHPAMPPSLKVWGAARSKRKLLAHALFELPRLDVLFVGHLGLTPVAHLLKTLGRARHYYVILHGIEVWKRVSFIDRQALKRATTIVSTTHYTASECAKHNDLPAEQFRVIPLCADERKVSPSLNFKLNGEFKLLCVARQVAAERYKGFEQTFQALAQLKPQHPNIHLNLVGTGDDQERLRMVVRQIGIQSQVTFLGLLSDEELAAAYRDCDLYVMPSEREGFGIVFLEAMRHGKACIGGNHGGTRDIIEHGKSGYLVGYGDVAALAENIHRLIQDDALRNAMGERGQKLIADKYNSRLFVSSYSELLMYAHDK